jgi:hypothetical protein
MFFHQKRAKEGLSRFSRVLKPIRLKTLKEKTLPRISSLIRLTSGLLVIPSSFQLFD